MWSWSKNRYRSQIQSSEEAHTYGPHPITQSSLMEEIKYFMAVGMGNNQLVLLFTPYTETTTIKCKSKSYKISVSCCMQQVSQDLVGYLLPDSYCVKNSEGALIAKGLLAVIKGGCVTMPSLNASFYGCPKEVYSASTHDA